MNTIRLNPIDTAPYRTFVTESQKELKLQKTLLIIAGFVGAGICIYLYIKHQTKEQPIAKITKKE
jgi:hypothetical protein